MPYQKRNISTGETYYTFTLYSMEMKFTTFKIPDEDAKFMFHVQLQSGLTISVIIV